MTAGVRRSDVAGASAAHASSHITGGADVIAAFTAVASGLVPLSGGGTTNFLRADGTWNAPVAAASDLDSVLAADSTIAANKVRTIGGDFRINDTFTLTITDTGRLALV